MDELSEINEVRQALEDALLWLRCTWVDVPAIRKCLARAQEHIEHVDRLQYQRITSEEDEPSEMAEQHQRALERHHRALEIPGYGHD